MFSRGIAGFLALILVIGFQAPALQAQNGRDFVRGVMGLIILNEIGKQNDKARPRAQVNTYAANEPKMSRTVRKEVQSALNILGFNAGAIDGAIGKGTRGAIRRYQGANGFAVTGYLTVDQLTHLRRVAATGAPVGEANPKRPLNADEYRQIQQALADLGYFQGAITGQASRETGRAVQQYLWSKGLDPDTTPALQALELALADTGRGPAPDGGGVDFSDGSGSAGIPGAGFRRADYLLPAGKGKKYDLSKELTRRVLAAQPELLTDEVVSAWVERYNRYIYNRDTNSAQNELTEKFYRGTPFEKTDAIAEFKDIIRAGVTDEPLKFRLGMEVFPQFADYTPGKGVPLQMNDNGYAGPIKPALLETVRIFLPALRQPNVYFLDGMPDVTYLPIDDESARKLAKRMKDDGQVKLFLNRYVTSTVAAASSLSDGAWENIVGEATLDFVEVVLARQANLYDVSPSEEVVSTWRPVDNARAGASAGGVEEFAAHFGIPVAAGHLVRFRELRYSGQNFKLFRNPKDNSKTVDGYWNVVKYIAVMERNRELFRTHDGVALRLADWTLSAADKRAVAKGKPLFDSYRGGSDAYTEFEFRRVMADIRENYEDRIFGKAPKPPLPIVEISEVLLGKYDFETNSFPIDWKNGMPNGAEQKAFSFLEGQFSLNFGGVSYQDGDILQVQQSVVSNPVALPEAFPMPLDKAEEFIAYLEGKSGGNRRSLFYANFANLDEVRSASGKLEYVINTNRAAFFADPELTELVFELPKEALSAQVAAVTADGDSETPQPNAQGSQAQANNEELMALEQAISGRQLDVLGIRVGMSAEEARAALIATQPAFKSSVSGLDGVMKSVENLAQCDSQLVEANRAYLAAVGQAGVQRGDPLALAPDARDALRQAYATAYAPVEEVCRPADHPLSLWLRAEASVSNGAVTDRVYIYFGNAGPMEGRVVAVGRSLQWGNADVDIVASLDEKFGAESYRYDTSDRFWTDSAGALLEARADRTAAQSCFPRYSFPVSYDARIKINFLRDCGTVFGVFNSGEGADLFLVDTRHFQDMNLLREQIEEQKNATAEAEIKL